MKMKFGIFMAPFHAPHHNPTLSLEQDLSLLEHLDRLGFDEAWIGEHHSAGSEIIASPEIFIMAAAARTQHIKLGTGVVSLPYHNPLWVAERMVEQIKNLLNQSNGGFGAYLTLAHNWANPAATKRSFELFAHEVMPHFQSSGSGLQTHANRAQATRAGLADLQMKAVAEAAEHYEKEQRDV